MAKVKHIVFGVDDRSLGQLIGLLANGGEIGEGSPDIIACPGNPQAFTIDTAGYLRPIDFCKAINAQAQADKRRAAFSKTIQEEVLAQDVVSAIKTAEDKGAGGALNLV